jgi:hypothetical protein
LGKIKARQQRFTEKEIPLFKTAKQFPEFAADNNWNSLWSGMKREPLIAAAAICHATIGLSKSALKESVRFFKQSEEAAEIPGRLLSVTREDNRFIAEILKPRPDGGTKLVRVVSKGDIRGEIGVGGAIDIYKRHGNVDYYRLRKPYITSMYNGKVRQFDVLDAKEVADVVRAQYKNLDFCGHWERREEVSDVIEQDFPNFPRHKCSYFKNTQTGDGILVFRGTNPLDLRDHAVNFLTMSGKVPPQYKYAPEIAKMVKSRFGENLLVAGHSKGGGLAQFVSVSTGIRAVCFNAVGLPKAILENARNTATSLTGIKESVDHFLVRYDWVSNLAGIHHDKGMGIVHPFTSKEQNLVGGKENVHFLNSPHPRSSFLALHSMATVSQCLSSDPYLIKDPFSRHHASLKERVVRIAEVPHLKGSSSSLTRSVKREKGVMGVRDSEKRRSIFTP